jgi:hypothetical protein
MSREPLTAPSAPNPDESPFALPAIAGLPYDKGSEEDAAVRGVIEEAERERKKLSNS